MAYVRGFEHDIFLSYAHVDDLSLFKNDEGWVTALMLPIENRITQKLCLREIFSFWRDRKNLPGNLPNETFLAAARASAIFLIVLSPGYVKSEACLAELRAFVDARGENAARDGNIFIIRREPIQGGPAVLDGLGGFPFWKKNETDDRPIVFGTRIPPSEDGNFRAAAMDLAERIADQMDKLRATVEKDGSVDRGPPDPKFRPVLLAEPTDDLDSEYRSLRDFLQQFRVKIYPEAPYTRPGLASAIDNDLARSGLFVQLLGRYAGRISEEAPDGYPKLQFERARKSSVQILQWHDPTLDAGSITNLHPIQKALLLSEHVHSTTLEQFKKTILEKARIMDVPPPMPPGSVFINHTAEDTTYATQLADGLASERKVAMVPYHEKASVLRKELDKRMLGYDHTIFIYGQADVRWIDKMLEKYDDLQKIHANARRRRILVEAPPPGKKRDISIIPMGLARVKAPAGITPDVIESVKRTLQG